MNEYFVTFDLAKKLKEKGFNEPCINAINSFGCSYHNGWCEYLNEIEDEFIRGNHLKEGDYLLPTISQVLEWLRNDKKIFVVVFIDDDSDYPVTYNIFRETDCVHHHHGKYFALSEWSKCEMAGIEYVLDNLI